LAEAGGFRELCARNLAGENFDDMVIHAAANKP